MFDDIFVVCSKLMTASPKDVSQTERTLGFKFPIGYREFVTKLGAGAVNVLIRVKMPEVISKAHQQWQAAWASSFFWDKGRRTLPKEKVLVLLR